MNRPLSREERKDIEDYYKAFGPHGSMNHRYLEQYIAAEAFWRDAVKKCAETVRYVNENHIWIGEEFCFFCNGELANQSVHHKPDCPWLLANES